MSQDPEYELKIVLYGNEGTGKTALLRRFFQSISSVIQIPDLDNTRYSYSSTYDNRLVHTTIWDTSGQEQHREITRQYYKGAHAVLFLFDVSKMSSFARVSSWIEDVQSVPHYIGLVQVLVGTHADEEERREVSYEAAVLMARNHGMLYHEVSAKTGLGVEGLFQSAVNEALFSPSLFNVGEETKTGQMKFMETHRRVREQGCACCSLGTAY